MPKLNWKHLGPFTPILMFFISGLFILSASRLFLLLTYADDFTSSGAGAWSLFATGLRFDVLVLCAISVFPTLLFLLLPNTLLRSAALKIIILGFFSIFIGFLLWMELYTPTYITEYGERPARIFYEYLAYPKDVIILGLGTYPIQLFLHPILACLAIWFFYSKLSKNWSNHFNWSMGKSLCVLPFALLVLALGIRSSIGHRPANISLASISSNHLVNQIVLNSSYSILHSIYRLKDEKHSANFYGKMPEKEVIKRVTRLRNSGISQEANTANTANQPPKNLVIILHESIGAQFVGSLGGLDLTPELDKWSKQGLWLSKLYATGTRSVRGVEAIITGFPPTPARSVVKLELAQNGFFTMAGYLKKKGYSTEFIYGGDSHFDNMHGFLKTNGFDSTIDERDYKDPIFRGSWGVSDEDLFNMAHQRLQEKANETAAPFFTFIFTGTNHTPYEFPDGRVDLKGTPKNTRDNAIQYADHAMGEFLDKAKNSAYWDNTVFMIVADHDARLHGAESVPITNFHIPGLFLGKDITPQVVDKITSQIDLGPTALALMGIQNNTPMIGKDVTSLDEDYPGFALMQYGNNHAYMLGESVVVHKPYEAPTSYTFVDNIQTQNPQTGDDFEEMTLDALALATWPSLMYKNRHYQLDQKAKHDSSEASLQFDERHNTPVSTELSDRKVQERPQDESI